jgi:cytochrome b
MQKHLIWDLPLRIFHWLFALTVLGSWYTSEQGSDLIEYHMQLGYFAIGLLIFRVTWGIVGPKHARFSQFVPSISTLIKYIRGIKQNKTYHSPGHNPLGSLMVILMIVLITLQAVSGLFINDDVFSSGPYYGSIEPSTEKVMSFLHHNLFNVMIIAIFLHLIAIAYYWKIRKENLILPMITGKKDAAVVKKTDAISSSLIPLAILIAIAASFFVYWLVVLNAPVIEEFY